MTSDELRKAAEPAGIRWMEIDDGVWRFVYEIAPSYYWHWYAEDPALPAFVADLLVAKVKTRVQITPPKFPAFATDEQRIRAAVAALEEGESE